jgi:hypothetical protein
MAHGLSRHIVNQLLDLKIVLHPALHGQRPSQALCRLGLAATTSNQLLNRYREHAKHGFELCQGRREINGQNRFGMREKLDLEAFRGES